MPGSTIGGGQDEANTLVAQWMELYDQLLAQQDVPVHERPLRAAVLFAKHSVERVRHEGADESVEDNVDLGDLFKKPWFGRLVRMSEDWYSKAFGPAALRPPAPSLSGAVMYRGAILILEIPVTIAQPADVGHQRWIAFPDHVGDGEDVLSWLQPSPEPCKMEPDGVAALEVQVRRIANSIRFVASRARNASKESVELSGLLAGAVRSLDAFPHLAAMDNRPERQKAWWELQMANEGFLKAFCLQKNMRGAYRRTHSIPALLQDAQKHGLDYDPNRFSNWPSEKDIGNHRYATGRSVSSSELFSGYELSLSLCWAVASSLAIRIDTGKARFLIQPLPWRLRELEEEQGT